MAKEEGKKRRKEEGGGAKKRISGETKKNEIFLLFLLPIICSLVAISVSFFFHFPLVSFSRFFVFCFFFFSSLFFTFTFPVFYLSQNAIRKQEEKCSQKVFNLFFLLFFSLLFRRLGIRKIDFYELLK